jgi:hypothetical protein
MRPANSFAFSIDLPCHITLSPRIMPLHLHCLVPDQHLFVCSYPGKEGPEIVQMTLDGKRLELSPETPADLCQLIRDCWVYGLP